MGNDESGVRTHAVLQPIGLKSIALDHSAIPPYLHTLIYKFTFKLFYPLDKYRGVNIQWFTAAQLSRLRKI